MANDCHSFTHIVSSWDSTGNIKLVSLALLNSVIGLSISETMGMTAFDLQLSVVGGKLQILRRLSSTLTRFFSIYLAILDPRFSIDVERSLPVALPIIRRRIFMML